MSEEATALLRDIVAATEAVAQFVSGRTLDVDRQVELLGHGVGPHLARIAVAARGLGTRMDERYPHVPWEALRGMDSVLRQDRHRAAKILWPTVEGLGKLRQACLLEISVIERGRSA